MFLLTPGGLGLKKFSEGIHAHELRNTRSIGLAKTRLQ